MVGWKVNSGLPRVSGACREGVKPGLLGIAAGPEGWGGVGIQETWTEEGKGTKGWGEGRMGAGLSGPLP